MGSPYILSKPAQKTKQIKTFGPEGCRLPPAGAAAGTCAELSGRSGKRDCDNQEVKKRAVSTDFISNWREFLNSTPYGGLFDWYMALGIENKQGKIGKDEAEEITRKVSLKAYEGGWKAIIIWMAEKMNPSATNKLLKLIEEPPKKTLFFQDFVLNSGPHLPTAHV